MQNNRKTTFSMFDSKLGRSSTRDSNSPIPAIMEDTYSMDPQDYELGKVIGK